jgi:hypothetical protein
VSSFNEHKKVLAYLLSQYLPSVFYQTCPPDAGFPRFEYEIKELNVFDIPYRKCLLTLNGYDKHKNEAIDELIDALLDGLDGSVRYTDGFYYQFYYQNDRQPVVEADKTLKRNMLTFEVRIYQRS